MQNFKKISFWGWVTNDRYCTNQGLPSIEIPAGRMMYLAPEAYSVARLYTHGSEIVLDWGWGNRGSDAALGIRAAGAASLEAKLKVEEDQDRIARNRGMCKRALQTEEKIQ